MSAAVSSPGDRSRPGDLTVLGLELTSEAIILRCFSGASWIDAARAVEGRFHDGEVQLLGGIAGRVDLIGSVAELPKGPPLWRPDTSQPLRWFTAFGFDWASGEALALPLGARDWVAAAHAVLRTQPKSFQLAGVAIGIHAWAAGASWQDITLFQGSDLGKSPNPSLSG